ncbi:hypothetical protein V8V91_01010 [Algoriphagus halophilus]|uniref:hypothetical protein n=1 Tax=Algoriphagus halophilus TaxID=226505 RepID=UPI00358E2B7B
MKEVNFGYIGKIKLNSYHPLCSNELGKKAAIEFGIHPYVDGSCRREPDFENPFPSISALCRQNSFAPKLFPNDIVIYISLNSNGNSQSKYRLVSILKVYKRFETHYNAYRWYRENNFVIPNNCMIEGNPPFLLKRLFQNLIHLKKLIGLKTILLKNKKR